MGAARESYEGCEARRLREEVSPFGWPRRDVGSFKGPFNSAA
jgi:hypothetical protein